MNTKLKFSKYWFDSPKYWQNFVLNQIYTESDLYDENTLTYTIEEFLLAEYHAKYIETDSEVHLDFISQEDLTYFVLMNS